ncbi:hypothetical protein [Myceligenerans cantabricum]
MTTDAFVAASLERFLRAQGRDGLVEFLANNPLMHLKMHQSYEALVDDALHPETVHFGLDRLSTPHAQVLEVLLDMRPYATRSAVVEHLGRTTDPATSREQLSDQVAELLDDLIAYAYAWPVDVAQWDTDPDGTLLIVNPGFDPCTIGSVGTGGFAVRPPEFTVPAETPVDDDAAGRDLGAAADAALAICRHLDREPHPLRGPDTEPDERAAVVRAAGVDVRLGELVFGALHAWGEVTVDDSTRPTRLCANPDGLWTRVSRTAFAKHLGAQWFREYNLPEIPLRTILDSVPDGSRILSPDALRSFYEWAHPFDDDGDSSAIPLYLEIAEAVGMMQNGAVTMYGRAMMRDRRLAGAAVASLLGADPAPLLLGDDLTATEVGEVSPELVRLLDLAADRRPEPGPVVWQFSADSLVRAAEQDLTPEMVRKSLEQAVQDEIPLALDELMSAVQNGEPTDPEAELVLWEFQISRILAS